jgi:hypothetical protein
MGMEFVAGYREANAPVRSAKDIKEAKAPAEDRVVITDAGRTSIDLPTDRSGLATSNETVEATRPFGFAAGTGRATAPDAVAAPTTAEPTHSQTQPASASTSSTALNDAMSQMQQDAPACDTCGSITVRNGTCYKCLNCGASMGCS